MIEEQEMARRFRAMRQQVRQQAPLIHCITHPITMNDSANLVLAVGARPIMAAHPEEAAEVTSGAAVLAVNLGNITDNRMAAIRRSGAAARAGGIPILIDLVGITCSTLRRSFARQFIADYAPAVIKGNISEIRLLCGLPSHASGVDAAAADCLTAAGRAELEAAVSAYAKRQGAVVFASGAVDCIADGAAVRYAANGTPRLAEITGTGCMLGTLTAVYLAAGTPAEAAGLAAVTMGLAGEHAARQSAGPGSFHAALFDALAGLSDEDLLAEGRLVQHSRNT